MFLLFEILLILLLVLFVVIPILYFIYSLFSKHYPCPYCGEKVMKSDRICPYCSENLKKLDTVDKKIVTIGKSFREGAEIRTKPEREIEKRLKDRKSTK